MTEPIESTISNPSLDDVIVAFCRARAQLSVLETEARAVFARLEGLQAQIAETRLYLEDHRREIIRRIAPEAQR